MAAEVDFSTVPPPPDAKGAASIPPPPDAKGGPELGPANLPPGYAVPMPGLPPEPKGAAWSRPPMSTAMEGILLGGGGALGGLPGQIVGGGLGGAAASPEHPLLGAAFGAALTGLTGTAGSIIGGWLGKAGSGFEKARESLTKAADAVRDKIPQGLKLFDLPGKASLTFDEAVNALRDLRGGEFKAGVADFIKQLDRVELGRTIQIPGAAAPGGTAAGQTFGTIAPKELFDPKQYSAIINKLASTPEGKLALGAIAGGPLAATLGPQGALRALIHRVIGGL